MDAEASFVFECLLPCSKIKGIFCFDHVFTHPDTTMNLFEFLLAELETFRFCFRGWRQVASTNVDLSREHIMIERFLSSKHVLGAYSNFFLKIINDTIDLRAETVDKDLKYFPAVV
jgi:hypothetical protein